MTISPDSHDAAGHVLVASPSPVVRQRVLQSMQAQGRQIEQASGGAEALVHLEKGLWRLLFLDRRLPDLDAEELSRTVRERFPALEVVLVDNESEIPARAAEPQATNAHADWFNECGNHIRIESQNETRPACRSLGENEFAKPVHDMPPLPGMVGDSACMQPLYRMAHLVAPRDTTVLISGPTGCGKELVARALHHLSPRAARSLAVINCAAIPETLLEAELFGYTRGAFTGALQSYGGRIQAAHLGTLFLDEIGDMPLSLQPKLLRFLEQKELQRLGSSQVVRVDARVVAATNADLLALVRQGKFREDLYYRLSAFLLSIPPLCERPGDVMQLASHFLEKFSADLASNGPAPILSEEAANLLRRQSWPGNVRELQNVIERALILAAGERMIRPEHLMFTVREIRG